MEKRATNVVDIVETPPKADNQKKKTDSAKKKRKPATTRKRKATVNVKARELRLQCEWGDCREVFENSDLFNQHLYHHHYQELSQFADDNNNGTLPCKWVGCQFMVNFPDENADLLRHLYFHGYHTKVKWWGLLLSEEFELGKCSGMRNVQVQSRNIIPDLPDGYKCEWKDCQQITDLPDVFYQHVSEHALASVPTALDKEQVKYAYVCLWEGCNYKYEIKDHQIESTKVTHVRFKLRDHMKCHTKEREYACPWCGSLYVNRTKLIDHIQRQSTTSENHCYQCTHCLKTFPNERLLKDHMRHHINHYKCPKCSMTCPTPSAVKQHIRYKHTEERPFACHLCPYKAKFSYDLNAHLTFHQSDLTYKCEVEGCEYAAKSLHNLKRHVRNQHELDGDPRPYCCHLCDHSYGNGYSLTIHLRSVHGFKWPPGHSRFRYCECPDGKFRLQQYRFESVELTEQLLDDDSGGEYTADLVSSIPEPPTATAGSAGVNTASKNTSPSTSTTTEAPSTAESTPISSLDEQVIPPSSSSQETPPSSSSSDEDNTEPATPATSVQSSRKRKKRNTAKKKKRTSDHQLIYESLMEAAQSSDTDHQSSSSSSSGSESSDSSPERKRKKKQGSSLDESLLGSGFCSVKDDDGDARSVMHDGEKYYVIRAVEQDADDDEDDGTFSLIKAAEFDK